MEGSEPSRYLRYLPGIYQDITSDLPAILKPFEAQLDAFEALLAVVDNYVTPGLTPAEEFLPWLAGWVALTLDEEWEEDTRRRLISQAVELYRWRGTAHGLRRYLQLYTGLAPAQIDIREACWPGGMQIGIASRIGGFAGVQTLPTALAHVRRRSPIVYHDYYVVSTVAPAGHPQVGEGDPIQYYLDADPVVRVEIEEAAVHIWLRDTSQPRSFAPATIRRRNHLVDDRYAITTEAGEQVEYRGDSLLVEEVSLPYRFVVRLWVPAERYDALVTPHWLRKVRGIIELEKPAHTLYTLRVQRQRVTPQLRPMQIGVRSTIGMDTSVS